MKHEVLFLNSKRTYVRVNDTWYDTHVENNPRVGEMFLLGRIEEVLDYDSYTNNYPESKDEIYPYVADKTISGGCIRRVVDGLVKYAVNPDTSNIGSEHNSELMSN